VCRRTTSRQRLPITASVGGNYLDHKRTWVFLHPAPGKADAAVGVFHDDPNDYNKAPLQFHGDFSQAGSSPRSPDPTHPRWGSLQPLPAASILSPIFISRRRLVPQRQKANPTIDQQQHLSGRVSWPPLTRPRARVQYPHTSVLENVFVPAPPSARPRRVVRRFTAGRGKQAPWNARPRGHGAGVPSFLPLRGAGT
jgi:hypothetical protein